MRIHTTAARWAAVLLLALAAGGCASDGESGPAAQPPAPTRELVTWVDGVCEGTNLLESAQARSRDQLADLNEPEIPPDLVPGIPSDFLIEGKAMSYLVEAPRTMEVLSQHFTALPPAESPGGDELVTGFLGALNAIEPELTRLTGDVVLSLSPPEKVQRARQVAELIASMQPAGPDLPALVAEDPVLARAYELAPRCGSQVSAGTSTPGDASAVPPTLPPAADGSDVGACRDGQCQIAVSEPVDIVIGSGTVSVSVEAGKVALRQTSPSGGSSVANLSGVGSTVSWGNGSADQKTTVRLLGISDDTAVLDFSSS
ncbi:MAG: hypothetical protein ACRDTC_05970 [Pseudonocardiaceae bacterium]